MTVGAGFSAAGLSPAGLGDVDTAPTPNFAVLVDAVTGKQQTARKIDPSVRNYVLDYNGGVQGMSGIQQMVLLRVKTALNSSALPGFGLQQLGGTKVTPNFQRTITAAITNALQDLVTAKLISIAGIQIQQPSNTQYQTTVTWMDLTTGTGPYNTVQQLNI